MPVIGSIAILAEVLGGEKVIEQVKQIQQASENAGKTTITIKADASTAKDTLDAITSRAKDVADKLNINFKVDAKNAEQAIPIIDNLSKDLDQLGAKKNIALTVDLTSTKQASLSLSQISGGLTATGNTLTRLGGLWDGATNKINQFANGIEHAGTVSASFAYRLSLLTVPLDLLIAKAIQFSADFEASMVKVETQLSGTDEAMKKFTDSASEHIIDLSKKYGANAKDISEALYFLVSSGIPQDLADKFLEPITKLATVGGAQAKDVAQAVTAAFNVFGDQLKQQFPDAVERANYVTELMFETIRKGRFDVVDFSQNFGRAAEQVKLAGGDISETSALLASLSQVFTPQQAVTALNSFAKAIVAPTKEAKDALGQLSQIVGHDIVYAFDQATGAIKQRDLKDIIVDIFTPIKEIAKTDMSKALEFLNAIFGDIRGGRAAQFLLNSDNFQQFLQLLDPNNPDGITGRGDTLAKGWEQTQVTLKNVFDRMTATFNGFTRDVIGSNLSPAIRGIVEGITGLLEKLSSNKEAVGVLTNIGTALAVLSPIALVLGTALIGAGGLVSAVAALLQPTSLIGLALLFEKLSPNIQNVTQSIKDFGGGINGIVGAVTELARQLGLIDQETANRVFKELGISVSEIARQDVSKVVGDLRGLLQDADNLKGGIVTFAEGIGKLIENISKGQGILGSFYTTLKNLLQTFLQVTGVAQEGLTQENVANVLDKVIGGAIALKIGGFALSAAGTILDWLKKIGIVQMNAGVVNITGGVPGDIVKQAASGTGVVGAGVYAASAAAAVYTTQLGADAIINNQTKTIQGAIGANIDDFVQNIQHGIIEKVFGQSAVAGWLEGLSDSVRRASFSNPLNSLSFETALQEGILRIEQQVIAGIKEWFGVDVLKETNKAIAPFVVEMDLGIAKFLANLSNGLVDMITSISVTSHKDKISQFISGVVTSALSWIQQQIANSIPGFLQEGQNYQNIATGKSIDNSYNQIERQRSNLPQIVSPEPKLPAQQVMDAASAFHADQANQAKQVNLTGLGNAANQAGDALAKTVYKLGGMTFATQEAADAAKKFAEAAYSAAQTVLGSIRGMVEEAITPTGDSKTDQTAAKNDQKLNDLQDQRAKLDSDLNYAEQRLAIAKTASSKLSAEHSIDTIKQKIADLDAQIETFKKTNDGIGDITTKWDAFRLELEQIHSVPDAAKFGQKFLDQLKLITDKFPQFTQQQIIEKFKNFSLFANLSRNDIQKLVNFEPIEQTVQEKIDEIIGKFKVMREAVAKVIADLPKEKLFDLAQALGIKDVNADALKGQLQNVVTEMFTGVSNDPKNLTVTTQVITASANKSLDSLGAKGKSTKTSIENPIYPNVDNKAGLDAIDELMKRYQAFKDEISKKASLGLDTSGFLGSLGAAAKAYQDFIDNPLGNPNIPTGQGNPLGIPTIPTPTTPAPTIPAPTTPPPTPTGSDKERASGGYAWQDTLYRLGEMGREFVMPTSLTQKVENMLGGFISTPMQIEQLISGMGQRNYAPDYRKSTGQSVTMRAPNQISIGTVNNGSPQDGTRLMEQLSWLGVGL